MKVVKDYGRTRNQGSLLLSETKMSMQLLRQCKRPKITIKAWSRGGNHIQLATKYYLGTLFFKAIQIFTINDMATFYTLTTKIVHS